MRDSVANEQPGRGLALLLNAKIKVILYNWEFFRKNPFGVQHKLSILLQLDSAA